MSGDGNKEDVGICAVDTVKELPAFMRVSQKVASNAEYKASGLNTE